jgi:hypothetical protein
MNYYICKQCGLCSFSKIIYYHLLDKWALEARKFEDNNFPYPYDIPIEQPLKKTLKKFIPNVKLECTEYYFYDRINEINIVKKDDVLRNISMQTNNICSYYAEHLLSDEEHKIRKKDWKKKNKIKINLQNHK